MKKLLLLWLIAGSANAGLRLNDGPVMAGDHLVWRNQNGWDIVLTHEKPDWCKGLGMMYSISPKGDANYGCWRTLNNRVHIEYQNGLLRNFVFDSINFRSKSE